ncbi:CVNH domain-containing protein [Endozoicomonas arenosclerae]|uniref:CVNH domain-containing protein n=1 Tax=Endozoicomonas arenosclerae TaxID=1633495 RepID=UPI00129487D7|nr:CVNH domain-containing protein [Endozoicomonas arenosclerae]
MTLKYTGPLDLKNAPRVTPGPGIGPCQQSMPPDHSFLLVCPFTILPDTESILSVEFDTDPNGLNESVEQIATVEDEEGPSTETFEMPPRPKISPLVKNRYLFYNTSLATPKEIIAGNEGPSSADWLQLYFFGNDKILFPETQPEGITYFHDGMIAFFLDSRGNPADYLKPGGEKNVTFKVQPSGSFAQIPFVYKFLVMTHQPSNHQVQRFPLYLVNTTNIPSGGAVAAGIVVGAIEGSHHSKVKQSTCSSLEVCEPSLSDPTDTSLNTFVIMGSPDYNRDISFDLVPMSSHQDSAKTTFQITAAGNGVSISGIKFNDQYLTCSETHSPTVSCTLLSDVKVTDVVTDVLTATTGFTGNTQFMDIKVSVEKGGADYPFLSQRVNVSVENDALPGGPYNKTCKEIKWDNNTATLSAQCMNDDKQWVESSIDYFNNCWQGGDDYGLLTPPGLSNSNGTLTCMAKKPTPGGSWVSHCMNPTFDGETLSASCRDSDDDKYDQSSVNVNAACLPNNDVPYPSGIPTLSNFNGHLACDLPNFTEDMINNCTLSNKWNGIDTLNAVCSGVPSSFSGAQYKQSCVYGTPLTVLANKNIGCKFSLKSSASSQETRIRVSPPVFLRRRGQ